MFDSTIPYDVRFLEALDRFMRREPWLDRDWVMIDFFKTIGDIAKAVAYGKRIKFYPLSQASNTPQTRFASKRANRLTRTRRPSRSSTSGGRTFRLKVPANPPVKLYWSATVYDRATHAFIRRDAEVGLLVPHAGADEERRRVDAHLLRPTAPARNESNWVPAKSGGTGSRPMPRSS